MVMNGKGRHVHGRLGGGEFTAANKGRRQRTTPASRHRAPPTRTPSNIDLFAMFNVKAADVQEGQLDLATATMSPEFQGKCST